MVTWPSSSSRSHDTPFGSCATICAQPISSVGTRSVLSSKFESSSTAQPAGSSAADSMRSPLSVSWNRMIGCGPAPSVSRRRSGEADLRRTDPVEVAGEHRQVDLRVLERGRSLRRTAVALGPHGVSRRAVASRIGVRIRAAAADGERSGRQDDRKTSTLHASSLWSFGPTVGPFDGHRRNRPSSGRERAGSGGRHEPCHGNSFSNQRCAYGLSLYRSIATYPDRS